MNWMQKGLVGFAVVLGCAGAVWLLVLPSLINPGDYRGRVSLEGVTLRHGVKSHAYVEPIDVIEGTIRNRGSRTIVFAEVTFTLLDENGAPVARRTDFLAHSFPAGDNMGAIGPRSEKRFRTPVPGVPAGWKGTITWTVDEVGVF